MRIEVRPGDDSWRDIQPLFALVYPPEVLAGLVWRDVTWANADSRVLMYEVRRRATGFRRRALSTGGPA
jgi:hypothetical protein